MQSAKTPTGRASKNTVGVQADRGMLRLSLPREVSRAAYGVAQKFIFPGLPDTPLNRKMVQTKADRMSVDIATGNFDVTWEKYELGVVAANRLVSIDGGKKAEIGILELWEKFKEYKKPSLAETEFVNRWEKGFTKWLVQAIEKTNGTPIEIRNYVVNNRCAELAKKFLGTLESAYKWGIQHKLVSDNPFLGMAAEITIKKKTKENDDSFNEFEDVRAFSLDEMNAIIEYFENTPTVSHWANYVKFLFWTGCRPGEAVALRWKHISPDCKIIKFSQSYDRNTKITKCTKTDTVRIFPCHEKLEALLLELKKEQNDPEALVLTSKAGKQIDWNVFARCWRGHEQRRTEGIIKKLAKEGKIRQYLKPYSTRHTFISAQVNGGIDAHVIAAWVGNSADIIWKHYYQHKQGQKPVNM